MGLRRRPFVFTEHGALMAATVLNSHRAVEMSLFVVRAFVRMREVLATLKGLAKKLNALERRIDSPGRNHRRDRPGDSRGHGATARTEETIYRLRHATREVAPFKAPRPARGWAWVTGFFDFFVDLTEFSSSLTP